MWRILFVLLVSGCAGTMQGVSQTGAVQAEWTSDLNGSGELIVHLDGDTYKGKHVRGSSSNTGLAFGGGNTFFGVGSSDSNVASALLFGPSNKTMECVLQYVDAGYGIAGGGIGSCQTSSGESIKLQF